MSRKYEWLDDGQIEFIPAGSISEEEERAEVHPVAVIGDPWGCAGVINGGWDGIEKFFQRGLDMVREARKDPAAWRKAVTEHLDEVADELDMDAAISSRLLREEMAAMGVIDGEIVTEQLAVTS